MTDINVLQRTQTIAVNMASGSVSVTNAGPQGPPGIPGEVTTAQLNDAIDTVVAKNGDTMTGLLILSGDPVSPLGAATRQYVLANAGSGGGGTSGIDGGAPDSEFGGTDPIDGGTP